MEHAPKEIFNFDKSIDRRGTNALKTDALEARYGDPDLLPLWVADMDFETPPCIIEALRARLDHPILGYTVEPPGYLPSIASWLRRRHDWEVPLEWISYIPGIVKGIAMVINFFTRPGDKVIIQPPVYHPFRLVPEGNGREVVYNPLRLVDDRLEMDLDHLERVIDHRCKILLLCNPHNPGGRTWDRGTLAALADTCERHGLLVVSDEIHADMGLHGHRHTPFLSASPAAARVGIAFGAPSKTFNIAGVVSSFAVIANDETRQRFYSWLAANELNEPTIFATIATEAAYSHGDHWLDQLIAYLEDSVDFLDDFLRARVPAIRLVRPQASFLAWLDCRGLGLQHAPLVDLFVKRARLALNDGEMFGPGGQGFMRMNLGSPRHLISQALLQLSSAISSSTT